MAEERQAEQEADGTFRPLSPPPGTMQVDAEGLGPGGGQLVVLEEDEYEHLLPLPVRKKRMQQRADAAALELARFEVSGCSLPHSRASMPVSCAL